MIMFKNQALSIRIMPPATRKTVTVPAINNPKSEPSIETILLETQAGIILKQTTAYARGMPTTHVGVVVDTIDEKPGSDPEDYTQPYDPNAKPTPKKYTVRTDYTEKEKRGIAKELRLGHKINSAFDFFSDDSQKH